MTDSLVIRGGTVVDGTGRPGYQADVLVEGDRIAEIGPRLDGDQVIDAGGLVVAPGFVDIHTHFDAQVFWDPALTPSCFHGVTSVVAGNCGFSIAPTRAADRETLVHTLENVEDMDPDALLAGVAWNFETFPEYLDSVRRRGPVLNYGAYVGHTPVRRWVMGEAASERAATEDEIGQMAELVQGAIGAGALGFSTSFAVTHRGADGQPIPSRWAERDEIEALCRAVADAGRGVVALNGGSNLSLREMYEMNERVDIPFTYTAILTSIDGRHRKAIDIHREFRQRGTKFFPQVSCRPLTFSITLVDPFTLNTNPVFAELMGRPLADRRAAYADPAWRARVRQAWTAAKGIAPRWDTYEVMESAAHPELIGQRLSTLVGAGDEFDTLLDLALAEPDLLLRVRAVLANDDVAEVTSLLGEAGCVLGLSDAGAHVGQLCDAPMPTDLLGRWVRDRGTMPIEQAIHKLSGEPAALFGLTGRGELHAGHFADVVIFDPATVDPGPVRRVRDFPANSERLTADHPTGVHHLLVNGRPVLTDQTLLESALAAPPGAMLVAAPR